jgi:hypothetical protein
MNSREKVSNSREKVSRREKVKTGKGVRCLFFVGGMVYHALNRENFRCALFKNDGHYQDFLDL